MRPKKRVVVLAAREVRRDVLCFLLDTWGYIAFPARTPAQFRSLIGGLQMDAVIAVLPGPRGRDAVREAQSAGTPVMSVDARANDPRSCGNVSLSVKAEPIEVREALRILTTHKRGPKKKPVSQPADATTRVS